MHYILDGYNIIYKLPKLGGTSIRDNREKLVKYIYKEKKQLARKNEISIVFDGQEGMFDYSQTSINYVPRIQTFFSHNTNADDYIIKLIKRADNPKLITVVTDDKELQIRTRLLEATAVGVFGFFSPDEQEVKNEEKPTLTYKELEQLKEELIDRRNKKCS